MKLFRPFSGFALLGAIAVCGCGALSDTSNHQQDPNAAPTPAQASSTASAPAAPGRQPADIAKLAQVPNTTVIDGKTVTLLTMPSGVKYFDTKVGTGQAAKIGDKVFVQYTGTLTDGTKFDSTADHGGTPFSFPVGAGQVIKGWDLGVPGMKVGGKRRLVIPGSLAYGDNPGSPAITPNATLVFDIELVSISK